MYQEALKSHTKKKKLSSAGFYSCETMPVDKSLKDDCLVIHVLNPMPLHKKLGIVNMLYDNLDQLLIAIGSKIRASDWAKACGLVRDGHYGGTEQFNGPACHKLLESLPKLNRILVDNQVDIRCKPVYDTLEKFRAVVQSCFGMVWYQDRYKSDIRAFAASYFDLIEHNKLFKIKLNIRPKVKIKC